MSDPDPFKAQLARLEAELAEQDVELERLEAAARTAGDQPGPVAHVDLEVIHRACATKSPPKTSNPAIRC